MITAHVLEQDVKLCAEALIDRAIVTAAADRALLDKIRRHAPALQNAFARFTGWRLQAHSEFARLVKAPARAEASHGLAWARGSLDYALLAWVLWYGEHTGGRKFTVSQIAEEIRLRSGEEGVAAVDWGRRDQRLAARRVFRGLEEMGVLRLQDGSVDEWADRSGKEDALYAWGDAGWRLHVGIPAAELEALAEGRAAPPAAAPEGTDEIRLYRTLLLNPALFRRDDPAAFRLLDVPAQCEMVRSNLKKLTHWELEVTPEYARVLRPAGSADAIQTPIPLAAGIAHVLLCFCGLLRDRFAEGRLVPAGGDAFLVDAGRIEQDVAELQARFGAKWGKTLREQPVRSLAAELIAEMEAWGLLRGTGEEGQYLVLPTAGRLAAHYEDDAVVGVDG
jgi:uncharacterized protein (TIGR02678 family)